jgi:hypothetical protein
MIQSSYFDLPEHCAGREATLRHLDDAATEVAETISKEFGRGFEGRAIGSHPDFGGYINWKIEVRRSGKLEAIVSIEWSEDLSPTRCCVCIADAEEHESVPLIALGFSAALGAVLSPEIAPGMGLAFALWGGAVGYVTALAWMHFASRVRPRRKSETVSLLEALTRETKASLVPA